jgi:hypothetical protein
MERACWCRARPARSARVQLTGLSPTSLPPAHPSSLLPRSISPRLRIRFRAIPLSSPLFLPASLPPARETRPVPSSVESSHAASRQNFLVNVAQAQMNPQLQREGSAGHLGRAFDALDIIFTALFTLELLLVMCASRFPRIHRALSPPSH